MNIQVELIETRGLGNRSYLATDGQVALVVDPPRDFERVLLLAESRRVRITHVLETHVHNDSLTGGPALAAATGATYVVAWAEGVAVPHHGVADGDELVVGAMRVRVLATAGHTHHHLAYLLSGAGGSVLGAFTGGSMLFGTAGRTDLSGAGHTVALTQRQWRSVRRLAAALPGGGQVWPTHGFGSFCSGGPGTGALFSTAAEEQRANPALLLEEATFVAEFLAGLGPYPTYYRHMEPLNRLGPPPFDPVPPPAAGAAEVAIRLAAGEWVVDLRPRRRFAAGHLPRSVNVEAGDSAAVYIGWVVPWGAPLTLAGDDEHVLAATRLSLARIGIEPVARHVLAGAHLAATVPVADFAAVAAASRSGAAPLVLDVREAAEWREGHLPGALHVPFHEVTARLGEIPAGGPVWVHCAAGFRAALAASLLARVGRQAVLVDDRWAHVWETALEVAVA